MKNVKLIHFLNFGKNTRNITLLCALATINNTIYAESSNVPLSTGQIIFKNLKIDQQEIFVSGRVIDKHGNTMTGVSVREKGKTTQQSTDKDGRYKIKVSSSGTLVFSYIGFQSVEREVQGKSNLSITMDAIINDLNEVVVIGYTAQRKSSMTGSIATLNVDENLRTLPTTSAGNILAGKLAGVSVNTPSGVPGSNPKISIRTGSSWNNQDVTYVIDGVVRDGGVFNELSPNEIENITVLKDAASAAIYGSRSAGGVILVTTRRGKISKPAFNYSFSQGIDVRAKTAKLTSALETGEIYNRVNGASAPEAWTKEEFDYFKTINNGWGYDQLDVVWKDPTIQSHNINVNGGSDKVRYFTGASYVKQQGFMKPLTYEKFNIRTNLTIDLTDNLQFFGGIALSNFKQGNAQPEDGNALYAKLLRWQPEQPVYTESGKPIDYGWIANIGASLDGAGGYDNKGIMRPQSVFNLTYKTPFLEGLSFKAAFSQNWSNTKNIIYAKRYEVYTMLREGGPGKRIFKTDDASIVSGRLTPWVQKDYIRKEVKWSDDYQLNLQANFDRTFGEVHKVQAALVYEKSETSSASVYGGRETFPVYLTDQFWAASGARADTYGGGDASKKVGRTSFIGQFNYSYADKYLINLSFREDGSMNFSKENRWGFFPAASAGWIVTKEDFFKDTLVDFLKLRGSIGLTGNDAVGGWQWQEAYKSGSTAFFGTSPIPAVGITYGSVVNPNLTWEKALSYDLGIDMNFIKNWNLTAEYWSRKSYDILGERNSSVPTSFSLSMPHENYGQVNAHGIDFQMGYRKSQENFSYFANLTMSYGWNKVIIRDYAENAKWIDIPVGKSINYLKGYRTDKIIRTQSELDKFNADHPDYLIGGQKPQLGMLVYRDLSGPNGNPDGIIDSWDKDVLASNNNPLIYGLNLGGTWKGFSIDAMLNGKLREQKSFKDLGEGVEWNRMWSEWYDNSWTQENTSAFLPQRMASDKAKTYLEDSDFWYKDGSFVRLKYITLGYTIPKKTHGKFMDSIRIYFTGTNLFTVSSFKYYDPELGNGLNYPVMRSYNLGIDVKF